MNYIIGISWITLLFFFFFIVGSAVNGEDHCGPYKILIGYIVYGFGIAVLGVAIQLLNLNWSLFRNLMYAWILFLIVLALYVLYRNGRIKIEYKNSFKVFITNYWAMILILLVVVFLTAINYQAFWLGNRSDDGFYLSRIASYSVTENPFEHDLATGLYTGHVINSYSLNTHDLEASVFFDMLGIPIGIFARIFLASEGLVVFACCIYALAYEIICNWYERVKYKRIIQFIPGILFLFTTNFVYLANTGIMNIQDSWQTSTAMYFGSSIVRTSGFFLLLLPFIRNFNLSWRTVGSVAAISVVLISKSTIAIPLIFVASMAYLFVWLFLNKNVNKVMVLAGIVGIALIGMILPQFISLEKYGFDSLAVLESNTTVFFHNIIHSFIPWLVVVGIVCAIVLKSYKILALDAAIFVFLFIPGFRTYGCILSFYTFVIGRVISAFAYFLICTMISLTVCELCMLRIRKSILAISGFVLSSLLAGMNLESFLKYGGNAGIVQGSEMVPTTVQNSLDVLRRNPDFMPLSTVRLADALQSLKSGKDKLAVLTETYYTSDGVADLKHILTRSVAPDVIFPAANTRFITDVDPVYGSYNAEQQAVFESFLINNDQASTEAFGELLNRYEIDAVLLQNGETYDNNMQSLGYSLYETVYADEDRPSFFLYAKEVES